MDFLFGLLPSFCPFSDFVNFLNRSTSGFASFLRTLNWFIPIADMLVILEVWGAAILIWYGVGIVLRTMRAIQ
jgi:hypothetical protein